MHIKVIKDVEKPLISITLDGGDLEPIEIHFNHTTYIAMTEGEANELQAKLGFAIQEYERTRSCEQSIN